MSQHRTPIHMRFWARVQMRGAAPGGCWEWSGYRERHGYGVIYEGGHTGRPLMAHRFAYELMVGPIHVGLVLDHLCRVRHCVNPAHLEPVTIAENVMRGETIGARNRAATHCKNGHAFDAANTRRSRRPRGSGEVRDCRTCAAARSHAGYMRRKASR